MSTVYIQKEIVDHINLINDTGADLVQYEFTVIGGLCLVADEAIASAAKGSFHVEENLLMQIADFVASEDTFATPNAPVFWDPISGNFSDTATAGYYRVGIVHTVKDAGGIVWMTKARDAVLLDQVVPAGEFGFIQYDVDADATTGLTNDFGFNFTVVDTFVECRAASGSGTITVGDSTPNSISSAMVCAVDTTIGRTTVVDDAYATVADGILTFTANGATDRGLVTLLVKGE